MLTDSQIKRLVDDLLGARNKLLWLINKEPINDVQRDFINDGRKKLKQVNEYLRAFDVDLPQ